MKLLRIYKKDKRAPYRSLQNREISFSYNEINVTNTPLPLFLSTFFLLVLLLYSSSSSKWFGVKHALVTQKRRYKITLHTPRVHLLRIYFHQDLLITTQAKCKMQNAHNESVFAVTMVAMTTKQRAPCILLTHVTVNNIIIFWTTHTAGFNNKVRNKFGLSRQLYRRPQKIKFHRYANVKRTTPPPPS